MYRAFKGFFILESPIDIRPIINQALTVACVNMSAGFFQSQNSIEPLNRIDFKAFEYTSVSNPHVLFVQVYSPHDIQ